MGWSNLPGKVFSTFHQQANRSLIHHPADIPDETVHAFLAPRVEATSDSETAVPVSLWIAEELNDGIRQKWQSWMSKWNMVPIDDEKQVYDLLIEIIRAESLKNDFAESNTLLITSLGEKWAFVFSPEKGDPKRISGKKQISQQEAAWQYLKEALKNESHIPDEELDWEKIRKAHYPKLEQWLLEGEIKENIHLYVKSSSNRDDTDILVPIRFQDAEYQQILFGKWKANFLHPLSQLAKVELVHKIILLGHVFHKGAPLFFQKGISSDFGSAKLVLWNKNVAGLLHEAAVSASIVILEENLNHKLEVWQDRKYAPHVVEKEQLKLAASFSPRASVFKEKLASLVEYFEEKALKELPVATPTKHEKLTSSETSSDKPEEFELPLPGEPEPIPPPVTEKGKQFAPRYIYKIAGIVVVALVLLFVTKQSLSFFASGTTDPLPTQGDTTVSVPPNILPVDSMKDEITKEKQTKEESPQKTNENPEKEESMKPVIQEKAKPEKKTVKEPEKEKVRGVELAKTIDGVFNQLRSTSLSYETKIELVPAVIRHFFAKKDADVFISKGGSIVDFTTVEEFLKSIVTQPKNKIRVIDQSVDNMNKILALTVEKTVVSQ